MKICYFANANNYHTIKWATFFAKRSHEVHILSLEEPLQQHEFTGLPVHTYWLRNNARRQGGQFQKLRYLKAVYQANRLISRIDPDVIHAHFASSYGLICSLATTRPFFLSVWGKDIYTFPRKNILTRLVMQFVLFRCTWLFSTSNVMANETHRYTKKPITITPFGVNMALFTPTDVPPDKDPEFITIGTVKALEEKYGINVLLRAFSIVIGGFPELRIELRIAGTGSQESALHRLSADLGIDNKVHWLGFISQQEAAKEWACLDIAVVPSTDDSESFGVAAIEAQACGTPLIISDIPGLREATNGGTTALCVQPNNPEELARAITTLIQDKNLRFAMARKGREYVSTAYDLNKCFIPVEDLYKRSVGKRNV